MKRSVYLAAWIVSMFWSIGVIDVSAQDSEEDASEADEAAAVSGEEIPTKTPPWTGRFDLGYTWQSGRAEKNELSLRAQADRDLGVDEYRLLGEFIYGEVEGVRNTQHLTGSFRWRRDISERVFTQTLTNYESDRIRGLRNRVEQNVGIGYRYLDSERFKGSVVPGFTVQYDDQEGSKDHWSYLASLSQDFEWQINPAYRFEEDINILVDPGDTDDHIVRFNAGLVGTLSDNINLSVRYQLLFENQVPPGVEETDQRIITSVGYSF